MVFHCKYCQKSNSPSQGRTLHGFPLEDAALMDIWKKKLKLHTSFMPTKHSKVCSDHFTKDCFRLNQKRKILISGSIPTIFSELKHSSCFYCKNNKDSKPGLSLRKFPLNKPELLQKWLRAIGMKNFVPNQESFICSDHFHKSCFRKIKTRTYVNLKANAVPSIFLKAKRNTPSQQLTRHKREEDPANFEELIDNKIDYNLDNHDPLGDVSNNTKRQTTTLRNRSEIKFLPSIKVRRQENANIHRKIFKDYFIKFENK